MKLVFHKPYVPAQEEELKEVPKEFLRNKEKVVLAQKSALNAFLLLAESAQKDGVNILVLSCFRPIEYQRELFLKAEQKYGKGKGIQWLAPAGYSEHHTGYAFDLADASAPQTDDEQTFENTPAFVWLYKNSGQFGFELSFPKNNWQNVGYEPWHWRFVGNEKAKTLFHPPFLKKAKITCEAILNGFWMRLG